MKHDYLHSISYENLEQALSHCPEEIKSYFEFENHKAGDIVCSQGIYYDYFYVIQEGHAQISVIGENGKKYIQAVYHPGLFFGELELFDKKVYIASVEATSPMVVLKIPRKQLLDWIRLDSKFALFLIHNICSVYYELSFASGVNALYSLKYRICDYLIFNLAEGETILYFDKNEITNRFAVTQRSVNRIVKELSQDGIISVKGSYIEVLDYDKLLEEKEKSNFN